MSKVDNFIKQVSEKRKELKLTLEDVALVVDHSKSHIWELEKGVANNPSLKLALRLSEFYGISIDNLEN